MSPILRTQRLKLRPWKPEDLPPFADMNANARVMEHFPSILLKGESDALVEKITRHFEEYGYGLWAVEIPDKAEFIGFIGLLQVGFEADFTPAVEIGWRLDFPYWGKGYATEGAKEVLRFAFHDAKLPEVVSFTIPANTRSRRVMESIGLRYQGTFPHPKLPQDHPLQQHVLYRLKQSEYDTL